ncbi:MAG: exodeoxyribonuclease III [Planctomycetes bacterium]|nr:exodeoxyribonuclease III [Planctomycetota bacterium]
MRLVTWNVNSIRARLGRLCAWLERHRPDVLCLQELKVLDSAFPAEAIAATGYHFVSHGQKTYNGVAILARADIEDVRRGLDDGVDDAEARLISARVDGLRVLSAYFPNGKSLDSEKYPYKLAWLRRLREYLERHHDPAEELVLAGDFNVALDERDLKEDHWKGGVLYNDEVQGLVQALLDWGLEDGFRLVHQEGGHFSWWDHRNLGFQRNDGLRIDHLFVTRSVAGRVRDAWIDRDQRKKGACPEGSTASDHAPVVLDLEGR